MSRFEGETPKGAATDDLKTRFNAKNVLFYIERSTNSNAVVYEANIVDGKLDAKDPVKVYWILYARDDPTKEEGLNMVERNSAYGSTTKPDTSAGDGHYITTLASLKTKAIKVSMDADGTLHAKTDINGVEAEILSVYVEATTSWGMPSVKYIDVKGRKPDGSVDTERIKK